MSQRQKVVASLILFAVIAVCPFTVAQQAKATGSQQGAVLWTEPTDIASRNLTYGSGGADHQPKGTMKFVEEQSAGSNPKFDVQDEAGTKWRVKLGNEAKSETAAAHLLWAVGYFTDEDYFLSDVKVTDMPKLKRGQKLLGPNGEVQNSRFERHGKDRKNVGEWKWKKNPFTGTRELNGLRVMMVLMNNWDLKDTNNTIYGSDTGEIYAISDLGATFGAPSFGWTGKNSRSNLQAYQRSKFISKAGSEYVDFAVPRRPPFLYFFNFPVYFSRIHQRWIGKHIPRDDVKRVGSLLARLSPQQIQDAFRSAGYTPEEVNGFAAVVQERIAELNKL